MHTVEVAYIAPQIRNKVINFSTGVSRTFFTAKGGFLNFRLFSLPSGRRGLGWRGIAESLLSRYYTTHTDAKGKALKSHKSFCRLLWLHIKRVWKRMIHITPTAKRNSVRVARLVGSVTQGSVLSPATLGWESATPSELQWVRTIFRCACSNIFGWKLANL